jgi:hypothetical protein
MANIPVDATAVMLHGVSTWFFFYRGKRLGQATGWHGLGQFEAASRSRGTGSVRPMWSAVRQTVKKAAKVRPIEKN